MSKKKKGEPYKGERFRLSKMEHFYLMRTYHNPYFAVVMSPQVYREFDAVWEDPENYPFRKEIDIDELPIISVQVELGMPL